MVTAAGVALFAVPLLIRARPGGVSFRVGPLDVLAVVSLSVLFLAVHEAIHALVMLGFGARPRFGAMIVGHVAPAFYTTADGHRFTRVEYLAIAAAPAVTISVIGFLWVCFGPWAGYLVLPLAFHLGGCVGDGFASRRVLREPPGTQCEDLRDGIRFHRRP